MVMVWLLLWTELSPRRSTFCPLIVALLAGVLGASTSYPATAEAAPGSLALARGAVAHDLSLVGTSENFDAEVIHASHRQLVLVDFWADWCAPCLEINRFLSELAPEFGAALRIVTVDVDREVELFEQLDVRMVPLVVLYWEGDPVDAFRGGRTREEIHQFIARHLR